MLVKTKSFMPFLLLIYKNHNHNTNIQNHIIQYKITKFPLININTYSFIHIHIHNNSRIHKFIYIYIYIQIHAITKQTVINSCHTTQLHIQFKLSHSFITHLSWLWRLSSSYTSIPFLFDCLFNVAFIYHE